MTEKKRKRSRRGRGEGGVHFDEARGLWVGSVSLGTDGQGRRVRPTVYGATKTEVIEQLDELRREARSGTRTAPNNLTVRDLMTRWLDARKPHIEQRTHEDREAAISLHVVRVLGGTRLSSLTSLHVDAFYSDMARGSSGKTQARRAAQCLVAALNYAVELRLIPVNPAAGIALPPEAEREMLSLTAEQSRALLAASLGFQYHPLFAVALGSGCRQGELLALTWDDISRTFDALTVRKALARLKGGPMLKRPKTKTSRRTLALPPFVSEALADLHAARYRTGQLERPVFSNRNGRYPSSSDLSRALAQTITRANRKGASIPEEFRFYDMRHTHASLLLSNGASLRAVSARLGHKDPAVTLRIYAHCLPGDDAKLADDMQILIGNRLATNGGNTDNGGSK